jgi:hypothetical protein
MHFRDQRRRLQAAGVRDHGSCRCQPRRRASGAGQIEPTGGADETAEVEASTDALEDDKE